MQAYLRLGALSTFTALVSGFASAVAAPARPTVDAGSQLVRVNVSEPSQQAFLHRWDQERRDVEIWNDRSQAEGYAEARVSPDSLAALRGLGLPFTIVVEDLQDEIDRLFDATLGPGFFDAYRTNEEHAAFLQDLASTYPALASLMQIGTSVQQRPIWALRITGTGSGKPGVLYIGAQHGNELTNPAVLAYMAQQLLTLYGADPVFTRLVDEVEWYVVPIVNPDGYAAIRRLNARGADLNRDWAVPGAQSAFSEPETAAVRDLLLAHPNIRGFLDLHTYGYYILWSWGYKSSLPPDHLTFSALAEVLADRVLAARGRRCRIGPCYSALYPAPGISTDYVYDESGIFGYTLEVGGSYAVPLDDLLPTILEWLPAMIYYAEWTLDCNGDGVPNSVELAAGAADCNGNYTPDVCESDNDRDSLIDACDADDDDDAVPDEVDRCPFGPMGLPVTAIGGPRVDANGDCRVGSIDYAYYFDRNQCLARSGPAVPATPQLCRDRVDTDDDADVDMRDVATFMRAFNGP